MYDGTESVPFASPHVYTLNVFLYAWVEDRTLFDWAHMVILFFRRHGEGRMRSCVSNSPIKTEKAKGTFNRIYSEDRVAWKFSQSISVSRLNSGELEKLSL